VAKDTKGRLSSLAAAVEILRSEGRPLTGSEIAQLAIQRGLIRPKGKTPVATIAAVLYVGIRDETFPIERLAEPGRTRAKRGSVRWTLKRK
jgi:hypothetical protein